MADKYDKLLSEYYTGKLDKKIMLLDRLAALVPLSDAQSKDYDELRADIAKLDDVIREVPPLKAEYLQARYGDRLPYAELTKRFGRSKMTLHKWKNKVKQRMREAGL
ncbi:hypothetical protein K1728_09970 [Weissella confusa]|uniref:hypothetical protein n=1 Tax=Weissella confusa TaxID=1583 RepID=UPI001C6F6D4D|nr:hypothetical protein [Weissella confusa]QYU57472.1 hypothetical protein K1728_09970 [Weissella confusa]